MVHKNGLSGQEQEHLADSAELFEQLETDSVDPRAEYPNQIGRRVAENAIIGATAVAALYLGQTLLIPLALAIFLTFLLSPAVAKLDKLPLPRALAVALVSLSAFSVLILLGILVGRQVSSFAEDLPHYKTTLTAKIRAVKDITSHSSKIEQATEALNSLRKEIDAPSAPSTEKITSGPERPPAAETAQKPLAVTVEVASTPLDQLKQTVGVVAPPLITAGIVILFVIILLLYREDVRDRGIRFLGVQDLERTTRAMDDAGHRLNRYFLATTTINTAFGTVIGLGLWWIGIPNPMLWGAVAMLLRYVPFVGVPMAAVLPLVLSVVVDPGWMMLAATLGLFVLSELFVSQVVETFVHGEATGLSPLAVILATSFWTLLWGPIGLVLAVPMTVMLAVLGRHIERFALFEVLLGAAPALSPADRFYQRILAGDPEEAADQAQGQLKELSVATYYDGVVMDALRKAMRDAQVGRLDGYRIAQIKASLDVFIDAMSDADGKVAEQQQTNSNPPISGNGTPLAVDSVAGSSGPAILCVAARNKLDETAAALLAQLLQSRGLMARVVTPSDLARGRTGGIAASKTKIVCLSAFDVGERSAQVKFLLRRLRRQMPAAEFLGGFWNLDQANPAHKTMISSIGADVVVSTLSSAVDRCILQSQGALAKVDAVADREPGVSAVSQS